MDGVSSPRMVHSYSSQAGDYLQQEKKIFSKENHRGGGLREAQV